MKIAKYIIVFLFVSCSTTKNMTHVKYNSYVGNTALKLRMEIPKGYKQIILERGTDLEKQYWYPDSSVIYITSDLISYLNNDNIRATGRSGDRDFLLDSLTLGGIDKNGLYWKDIKMKKMCVGYVSVPKSKKKQFEDALKSIKIK
jgi:hypothetical protein